MYLIISCQLSVINFPLSIRVMFSSKKISAIGWMLFSAFCFALMGAFTHSLKDTFDWRITGFARAFINFIFVLGLAVATKKPLLQRPPDSLISLSTLKKCLLRNLHFYRLFLTTYLAKVFSNLKKPLLKSRPYLPDKSVSKSIVIFNSIQSSISLKFSHFIHP